MDSKSGNQTIIDVDNGEYNAQFKQNYGTIEFSTDNGTSWSQLSAIAGASNRNAYRYYLGLQVWKQYV